MFFMAYFFLTEVRIYTTLRDLLPTIGGVRIFTFACGCTKLFLSWRLHREITPYGLLTLLSVRT